MTLGSENDGVVVGVALVGRFLVGDWVVLGWWVVKG